VFQGVESLGRALDGSGKAKLVWAAVREGRDPWTDEGVTPKAREVLARQFDPLPTEAARTVSKDGTVKLLVSLRDGLQIESVIIPFPGRPASPKPIEGRTTVCVSSQVGCSRGCVFCATGQMGLIRNLDADEIVAQVALAQRVIAERNMPKLNNVVFMGMVRVPCCCSACALPVPN
jgi:23S rRNA (adenine2503-C2)-methyltransferase